jgi:multicomponent Na+:H+ antiporter subunit E
MRSFGYVVALAVIWVLLWGSASPANVASGLAIGGVLVVLVPGLRRRSGGPVTFRPLAIARLVGYMLVVTVRSNVELTKEVLSRSSRIHTAVVGVPLPGCSDELLTLISNLLAISPGTMPLELRQNPIVLYVHILHLTDIEQVRRDILHLTDLTVRAFGSAEAVADQEAYMRTRGTQ